MFIGRRPDGAMYGAWSVRQWPNQEELPDDHADVVGFLKRVMTPNPDKIDVLTKIDDLLGDAVPSQVKIKAAFTALRKLLQ